MLLPRLALAGLFLALSAALPTAQMEHGGRPPSQLRPLQKLVPTARMRPVDANLLLAEDEQTGGAGEPANKPLRFAEVLPVDLGLANSGVWEELPGGGRVWRLRVHSPGAKSLALVFQRYALPAGAELYVHDATGKVVRGAYTEHENRLEGDFAMRPLRGDSLTLEYFEPASARGQGELALGLVAHDYRGVPDMLGAQSPLDPQDRSGGGGGTCEVDVACALGDPWGPQVNACVRIESISAGTFCSGSLLNNTANDGTLLVLAAAHCGTLSTGVFTFNFERPDCRAGFPSSNNVIVNATQLVYDEVLDVQLVRLAAPQGPAGFPVVLAGWDRSDVVPASTILIHHPGGAVKKISRDADAPVKTTGNFWRVLTWERGVTEGGSSGAPYFDPAGRFIGNMDSGASSCPVPNNDFCTRLAISWPVLEPFLDPLGTGQLTTDALDLATVTAQPFTVTGIFPSEIPVLDPSPVRKLRILGTGLPNTTEVVVNGIPLLPYFYTRSGHSFINVDMPPLAAGQYMLGVRENGATSAFPLTVSLVNEPRLQLGLGNLNEPVNSTFGLDTIHADTPGHVHYCFWSLTNQPSIHPLLTLGLGNNFTSFTYCRVNTIPARGFLRDHHDIKPGRLPFGTTVYTQTACVSHGLPLPTSNMQQTVFQF